MAFSKTVFSSFLSKTASASQRFLGAATFATEAKATKGVGLQKLLPVSKELQAIVGAPEVTRPQATKLIWAYIKAKNLQLPNDKRTIKCDDKLKKIFGGKDTVGMFEMAKLVSPHFKN